MVNVASLKPSDIERLGSDELSEVDRASILSSLQTMLREVRADGGADSDRIYMAAQMLDMANVWDQIGAGDLAAALADAPQESIKILLEGLPHPYAAEVAYKILTEEAPVYVEMDQDSPYRGLFAGVSSSDDQALARAMSDLIVDLGRQSGTERYGLRKAHKIRIRLDPHGKAVIVPRFSEARTVPVAEELPYLYPWSLGSRESNR